MKLRKILGVLCAAALLISAFPATLAADTPAFTDAKDIQYQEAVTAVVKLGLMSGKSDGSFDPEGIVSRAEAAKLVAILMNGGKDLDDQRKTEPSFTDIKGHWAESYIEYCADMGIICGVGGGTFAPEAEVTGIALVKMALCALGYDAAAYKLTGEKWADRADELARHVTPSLYTGLVNVAMGQGVSRDAAAQILYNALQGTPKIVKPASSEDGAVTWEFADATDKDGNPQSLLKMRFDLDEVGELSV